MAKKIVKYESQKLWSNGQKLYMVFLVEAKGFRTEKTEKSFGHTVDWISVFLFTTYRGVFNIINVEKIIINLLQNVECRIQYYTCFDILWLACIQTNTVVWVTATCVDHLSSCGQNAGVETLHACRSFIEVSQPFLYICSTFMVLSILPQFVNKTHLICTFRPNRTYVQNLKMMSTPVRMRDLCLRFEMLYL